MIKNYADHAANERTFLASLRTGLSVAAFGIVVERLNLLLAAAAEPSAPRILSSGQAALSFGHLGRFEGLALGLIGVAIIILGGARFVRTTREIDRAEQSMPAGSQWELVLSGALALLAATVCVYLALQ